MTASEVEAWFVREVLPLEAMLMQYLRRNWRDTGSIEDLRQEIYVRVCEAARKSIPRPAKSFVFVTARNLIIDRVRKEHVVPIEAVADLDALAVAIDMPGPERNVIARDELRRLQAALDQLPPRSREAIILGRIEGLTGREIARRMNIAETTVSEHLANGMHALTNILLRTEGRT
ncbi:MAG TPA: RNA polymerase sigma factor [Rhizomicrobium sp.]|nr:RNA polymerase sigma factor [Rhizomicrobium sp.]